MSANEPKPLLTGRRLLVGLGSVIAVFFAISFFTKPYPILVLSYIDLSRSSVGDPSFESNWNQVCDEMSSGLASGDYFIASAFADEVQELKPKHIQSRDDASPVCEEIEQQAASDSLQIGERDGTSLIEALEDASLSLQNHAVKSSGDSPTPSLVMVYTHYNEGGELERETVDDIAQAAETVLENRNVILRFFVGDNDLRQELKGAISNPYFDLCVPQSAKDCFERAYREARALGRTGQ